MNCRCGPPATDHHTDDRTCWCGCPEHRAVEDRDTLVLKGIEEK